MSGNYQRRMRQIIGPRWCGRSTRSVRALASRYAGLLGRWSQADPHTSSELSVRSTPEVDVAVRHIGYGPKADMGLGGAIFS